MRILGPLGDAGCPVVISPSPGAPPGPAQELGIADCGVSAMVSRDDGHLCAGHTGFWASTITAKELLISFPPTATRSGG